MNAKRRRPTMPDVAAAAGVSLKTVSRVVNKEEGVTEPTRERVEAAIRELGYRPNILARSLRPGQPSALIGLLITDITNPFYSSIASAIERVARSEGYSLIVVNTDEDPERERQMTEDLMSRGVDGLIVVPSGGDSSHLIDELNSGTAIVCLDRAPASLDTDSVLLDDAGGAFKAATALVARGHTRIGFIGDSPEIATAAARFDGFASALKQAGITLDDELIRLGSHDVESARKRAAQLLSLPQPPTALFTTNNRNTIGVLREIDELGLELDVVGFDDFELAGLLRVPVTVVAFDAFEMGMRAAEILFERIGGLEAPARHTVIPTRLITYELPGRPNSPAGQSS